MASNSLTGKTAESCSLYIVGHPVAHSKSPVMHNAAYRALGLEWNYGFADCPTSEDARAFLDRADWLAANVTMPYKPLALSIATSASDSALLAEGANVVVNRGAEKLADNTDGRGCVAYLQRKGVAFAGASVLVCGTGPTSLAIMHAAAQAGASRVVLVGRDAAKARRVLEAYQDKRPKTSDTELVAGSYGSHLNDITQADVVIDATSLGMNAGDPAPFDTGLLQAGQVVFDVVYGHGETALAAGAHAAGCSFYDGAGMLVAQAVETVYDIADWLDAPFDLQGIDLFSVMAQAAGFATV